MANAWDIAKDLVTERFHDAESYGDAAWNMSEYLIDRLATETDFDVPFSNLSYAFPAINVGEYKYARPSWTPGSLSLKPLPTDPALRDVTIQPVEIRSFGQNPPTPTSRDIVLGSIPEFTEPSPTLTTATLNQVDVPDFGTQRPVLNYEDDITVPMPTSPGDPPATEDPDIPIKPIEDMPIKPSLWTIPIPSEPKNLENPVFEGVFPSDMPNPPANTFIYNENEYSSELKTGLQNYLLSKISNLNTTDVGSIAYDPSAPQHVQYQQVLNGLLGIGGLDSVAEAAYWNRAIEREALKHEANYQEAERYYAVRSWKIPPGALSGRLLQIQAEKSRGLTSINAEILLRQTDLIYKTIDLVVTKGIDLEKACMSHTDQAAQRAFESAKYTQEAAIQIYNALSAQHAQQLDAYKTRWQVLETQFRIELQKLEKFKLQIESGHLSAELQDKLIKLYNSQLTSVELLWKIYVTEMEGANIRLGTNKMRLESFHELVNIFTGQLGAVTSQYNCKTARMAGETEKARMFEAEARAYEAMVGGRKAKADINIAEARAHTDIELSKGQIFEMFIKKYLGELEGAKLRESIKIENQRAHSENDKTRADIYDSTVRGFNSYIEGEKVKSQANIEQAKIDMERNEQELKKYKLLYEPVVLDYQMQLEELKTNSTMYGYDIEGYKSDLQFAGLQIEADIKSYDAQSGHEDRVLGLMLKESETNLQAALSSHNMQVESLRSAAGFMVQLSASAMSSVNAAAHLTAHVSDGYSVSKDLSKQEPTTSHNHIYNET
jgi:hypothetical protein